jgi:hypothetical protein
MCHVAGPLPGLSPNKEGELEPEAGSLPSASPIWGQGGEGRATGRCGDGFQFTTNSFPFSKLQICHLCILMLTG